MQRGMHIKGGNVDPNKKMPPKPIAKDVQTKPIGKKPAFVMNMKKFGHGVLKGK